METNRDKKLTKEQLLEAEAYFNVATLLGKSIQAAAYHITHPEYEPDQIVWVDKPEPPEEDEEEEDQGAAALDEPTEIEEADGPRLIHSNEASIDSQINQIMAMYTPGLHEFLQPSALCEMFHLAMTQFEFEIKSSDPDQEMSASDRQKAAIAWVIAKRVFAVRHPDETILIISASEGEILKARPISFRPMDKTDEQFIIETCKLLNNDFDDQEKDEIIAKKLDQLAQSSVISTPTSMAFWRQNEAAALGTTEKGRKKKLKIQNVYTKPKPADVLLAISDKDGQPLKLNGFDMALQAAVGQMIRENDNKPVQATPAQLYRKCAGLESDASVSPATIEETINSINKMRQADAVIFYEDQRDAFIKRHPAKSRQSDFDYSVTQIDGKLIMADRKREAYVAPNGKIINDVFIFYRPPILEHYSYGFKQLMEVDKKYLAGALNKATPENISFARYILVQVNRIKKNKAQKKIPQDGGYAEDLTFETIADRCAYDVSSRKKLRNFQDKVLNYCENLASMKHIKKAERIYKNRILTGVRITV